MDITLYNNVSPPNRINKMISTVSTLSGSLRDETNVVTPVIDIVSANAVPPCNYARIEAFGRYYYIMDIRQVRRDIWRLRLKSDPLMSFDISGVSGIVTDAENIGSPYLEHPHFIRTVKSKTDIIPFSNGLLDSGEYILITAGGGGS